MVGLRVHITVQYATSRRNVPAARTLRTWVRGALLESALKLRPTPYGLTVRIVSVTESRALNRQWRGKDKPTNVLSFSYSSPSAYSLAPSNSLLGDLVICAPVVAREARE